MKPLTHFGTRLRAAEGWSHRATEPWSGHGPSWLSTWREHTASLDSAYPQPEHLKQRYGELFGAEFDVLLYDLTSTYVEGACHDSRAAFGFCGFPVFHDPRKAAAVEDQADDLNQAAHVLRPALQTAFGK